MTDKADIEHTDHGLVPADAGWFILNLSEIRWETIPGGGTWCSFESDDDRSPLLGIGVHILGPGESSGYYHAESNQEGFLVLSGECIAIVEGEELRMRQWGYLHCPPGTAHITVGAGPEPCALLMVGTRSAGATIHYSVEPAAAKHGASVEKDSDSPREVYADKPPPVATRSPGPLT
jgi:uncharacterized cupin superfamily protein